MKKLLPFLVILFALFTWGCGTTSIRTYTDRPSVIVSNIQIIPVYIDKDFAESDKIVMQNAINQWNRTFNGQMRLELVSTTFDLDISIINQVHNSHRGIIIMPVDSTCKFIPVTDEEKMSPVKIYTVAWTVGIGGNDIYVVRDRIETPTELFGVMLHEFGHALGAPHTNNANSLMSVPFRYSSAGCIDKWTAMVVAIYQHLSTDVINYCY